MPRPPSGADKPSSSAPPLSVWPPLPAVDYKRLFETQPGLYMILSTDLRIITVSDAYARATLIKREDVVGRPLFEVFPDNPADLNADGVGNLTTSLQRVLKTRAQDSMALQKYDVPKESGGFELKYWSPVNTPVLGADGEVQCIVHQAVDATAYVHRLQSEKNDATVIAATLDQARAHAADIEIEFLERAKDIQATARKLEEVNNALSIAKVEAESANRAKSAFLASMSHEIRTPLNGIIGNLELLAHSKLAADQHALLNDADKAAKSLMALIGNVLDFAKIEAGKLSIENVAMNPATLVQETADILQSRARQKHIQITFSVAGVVPETVEGDPDRIRQILLNLVGNAVKFTTVGGVHVRLEAKDAFHEKDAGDLCDLTFTVYDSGLGFDPAVGHELFQPFTQDQKMRLAGAEGTGLGLAICRSLVETLGGAIGCGSAPGRGSMFWFTLPMRVLKSPIKPGMRDDWSLRGRNILMIARAHRDGGEALTDYFKSRGANVLTVYDDDAALSAAHTAISMEQPVDMAVYVANGGGPDDPHPGFMAAMRSHHVIPAIAVRAISPLAWYETLRAGASYVLTQQLGDTGALDSDMRRLFEDHRLPENTASSSTPIDNTQFAGKRVLVLEDRLINQTIVRRQLLTLGVAHTIAENGIEGLAKLNAGETFDAILCDCSMPHMNGYDFTRVLRTREAQNGAPRLPVIAMTANAFREDVEMCQQAGMDDFVSKPVTLQRLSAVLTKWLLEYGA